MSAIDNLIASIRDFPDELINKLQKIADEMVPENKKTSIPLVIVSI